MRSILSTLTLLVALRPQGAPCIAVPDSLRTESSARLRVGTYSLSVVRVTPNPTVSVNGTLVLKEATPSDQSPQGLRLSRRKSNGLDLWGHTTVDFAPTGLDLPATGDSHVPAPSSTDPIFPGVVVLIENRQTDGLKQNTVWIASGANDRSDRGYHMRDGPGLVMHVRELTPTSFRGTWEPAGLQKMGGYFCATRN
jgi:hypothetical protein